jgi:hypothetical protein
MTHCKVDNVWTRNRSDGTELLNKREEEEEEEEVNLKQIARWSFHF